MFRARFIELRQCLYILKTDTVSHRDADMPLQNIGCPTVTSSVQPIGDNYCAAHVKQSCKPIPFEEYTTTTAQNLPMQCSAIGAERVNKPLLRMSAYSRFIRLGVIRFQISCFSVACYATLHPALSVGRSHFTFFIRFIPTSLF